tara:strand:+ start:4787 stop:5809 length:1023 start_codon:yes stop_codon:yes gene_type:complete
MKKALKIAVLGGGSFGTTLCNLIAEGGSHPTLWLRSQERADEINREHRNSYYLADFQLNPKVQATTDIEQAVSCAHIVFVAVPSHSCRSVSQQIANFLPPEAMVVSVTKGIETAEFKLMSQVLKEELSNNAIGVLSGPNLAIEIVQRQLTGTVIASESNQLIETVQAVLQSNYFRVYSSRDIFGVELGGALKNIYAIISGMAAAMKLGDNTKAMLMTRSLAEMSRFAVSMGANPLTFLGLAGVGDLIVTCSSSLSRNYQVGYAIGNGQTLQEATEQLGQVAEGVNTLKLVVNKANDNNIYMPLASGLFDIIFKEVSVACMVEQLMMGEQSQDVEFLIHQE